MAEDIKLVIGTDNPTIVVTAVDKVNIRDAAKSSEINFVATGSSGIKGDTGPQGPAGTGITTEQAAAIDTNTAKNSFDGASLNKLNNIEANAQVNRALLDEDNMASDSDTLAPTQQSVKAYVDGQTHLQIGVNSTNALAGNTTTISTEQASAIIANTSKTGITTSQASAIVTNTAKTGITTSQASAITANTAKTGITTSQANAITANTSKTTNATHTGDVTGSVALTIGDGKVVTDKILDANVTTAKIADDSITEDKLANTLLAEIDANTAKETNVVQTTVTGNAGTATILETARAINDVDFNGSVPITITAAGSTLSDTVPVSKGGTGATAFAYKAVMITSDSGTNTLAGAPMSTNGQLLIGGTSGPVPATLTQGNGITITNANGGITLTVDNDIDTSGESGTVDNIGSLTGDVTSSNRATTIANDAVTYAKMQNVTATNVVLGRDSAGAGVVEEISASSLRDIINVEDGATADQTKGDIDSLGIAATTAVSLTAGNKTIDGDLLLGGNDDESHYIIRQPHTDNLGGRLYIQAGAGGGTNKPGGTLLLQGGASTGNAGGGSIVFTSSAAGSSGSSANSVGVLGSINSEGKLVIEGDLTVKGNDIKDDDGTTCITFDSSGNTTVSNTLNATLTGNVTGSRLFNKSSTSNNNLAQGDIIYVGGGSTTAGDLVYMKTNGEWGSAQANAASTSTSLLGIALGTDPDVNGVLLRGTYTLDHDIGNNQGVPLYISDGTAGQATATIPNTSGDIIRIIGYNIGDDDEIWFNPDKTFIEV